jgi:hypothetical protein
LEINVRGSIRFFAGLLVAFGAVGTMDADPSASLMVVVAAAAVGLGLMYSGVRAMQLR